MAMRQHQKQIETRIHTQLYEYFLLLRHLHSTTKEFDTVCKPDMFMKNNKAAFQHTIYYLLKILNPKIIKQQVPSWPILDNKMDVQFRKEVMTYINDFKKLYPNWEIPTVVSSHLINPGGFKFVSVMLDIARLVVSEALANAANTNDTRIHNPKHVIKYKEHTSQAAQRIASLTSHIQTNTADKLQKHNNRILDYQKEAEEISVQLLQSKTNIFKLKKVLNSLQMQANGDSISDENINALEVSCHRIKVFQQKFNHSFSVLNHFRSNDCFINYDPSDSTVGGNVRLSSNLLEHFSLFQKMCSTKIFDVCRVPENLVGNKIDLIIRALMQYNELMDKCLEFEKKQIVFLKELKDTFQETSEFSNTLQDSQQTPQNKIASKNTVLPQIVLISP